MRAAEELHLDADFIRIESVGHSLGNHPLYGPIEPESVDRVVVALNQVVP